MNQDNRKNAHQEIDHIFKELLPAHGMAERPAQVDLSHRMLDAMLDGSIAPVRRRDGDRKDLRLPGGGNGIPPMPGRFGPALSPSPDLDLQHRFAERGAQ